MKKILCFFLIAFLFGFIPGNVLANSFKNEDLSVSLKNYFSMREQSFADVKNGNSSNTSQHNKEESMSEEIRYNENQRVHKLWKLVDDWGVKLDSARTSFDIKDIYQENDLLYVEVYEWTLINYISNPSFVDTAGYGVNHQLIFSISNGKLKLLDDQYDEGPLTGMATIEHQYASESNEDLQDITQSPNNFEIASTSVVFNPSQAARYARRFVYPQATFGMDDHWFESYYNRDYQIAGYLAEEGNQDCTNYVSQALHFGGLPMISTWKYYENGTKCNDTSHVAKEDGGHICTDDDTRTGSWAGVGYFKDAMVGVYATLKEETPEIPIFHSDIDVGDVVQYDFRTNENTNWNHSVICTGKNSSNIPVVCSHNWDYYDVPWYLIVDGETRFRVIQITPPTTTDDFGNAMEYTGNVFRITMDYVNGKINYGGDVDFIKFTPYVSKNFLMYTTGSLDTYGQLYDSAGVLLQSNDDSGEELNFLMNYSLTKGKTYYIKIRHYNSTQTGSYTFYIRSAE